MSTTQRKDKQREHIPLKEKEDSKRQKKASAERRDAKLQKRKRIAANKVGEPVDIYWPNTRTTVQTSIIDHILRYTKELESVLEEFLWIQYLLRALIQRISEINREYGKTRDPTARDAMTISSRVLVEYWRTKFVEGQGEFDAVITMVEVLEPIWDEVDIGDEGEGYVEDMGAIITDYLGLLKPLCDSLEQVYQKGTPGYCGVG